MEPSRGRYPSFMTQFKVFVQISRKVGTKSFGAFCQLGLLTATKTARKIWERSSFGRSAMMCPESEKRIRGADPLDCDPLSQVYSLYIVPIHIQRSRVGRVVPNDLST